MKLLKGLNDSLKDFDGQPLKDNLGQDIVIKIVLANALALTRSEDAVRMTNLAREIYSCDGEIQLEDADFNELKKAVNEAQLTNISRAPIQEVLDKAEDIKKED